MPTSCQEGIRIGETIAALRNLGGQQIREAGHAESKADFIHKTAVAQKEINETMCRLELLAATDYLTVNEAESLRTDAVELLNMLTSTIKTAKANLKAH
ncbi:MAG TPA: four helix bundle protein [Hymenobacter sp.]|jgi:four helix bundle protein|uniref:four helix bundle protein n=1 Tax=Hymenobacter sp. TaxID=1898978 RepID=UPI002EDB71DD